MGVQPIKRHSHMRMMHMNIGGLLFLNFDVEVFLKTYFMQRQRWYGVPSLNATMVGVLCGRFCDFVPSFTRICYFYVVIISTNSYMLVSPKLTV